MASARCSVLQTMTVLALVMGISQTFNTAEEENEEELNTATVERKYEAMECPSECSCTAEWAVDCAGVDLVKFPTGLSEQTRQLSLQVCKMPQQPEICCHFFYLYFCRFIVVYVFHFLLAEQQNRKDLSRPHFPSATTRHS